MKAHVLVLELVFTHGLDLRPGTQVIIEHPDDNPNTAGREKYLHIDTVEVGRNATVFGYGPNQCDSCGAILDEDRCCKGCHP